MMNPTAPTRTRTPFLQTLKEILNQPVLPARPAQTAPAPQLDHLPIPGLNAHLRNGYQLETVLFEGAGSSGRYTRFAIEFHSHTGKPFTSELTRELPPQAIVIGAKVQYMDPEKLKPRIGSVLRIGKVEPDGSRYMVEARPTPALLALAAQNDPVSLQKYMKSLPWQKI
ncbi:hypothetical protein [Deinococcus cellulosilyticus]|uniref:Uncharacterized protein n=1 Tax=Deinococcus cellulosilyticus (strain DSM 18568 / NBRC 106333 / KACC 11606 / 5516J-15) TaxID=1223518 RepID=A0A511MXX8_DEIC1|nr:hypothetical protein [Deinococcus cellulosilyticus]GEM44997.1 hypothetical protein DC3_06320 [Deinococcus cellulosilyticus NBRC 106333 = KACC 11606]